MALSTDQEQALITFGVGYSDAIIEAKGLSITTRVTLSVQPGNPSLVSADYHE